MIKSKIDENDKNGLIDFPVLMKSKEYGFIIIVTGKSGDHFSGTIVGTSRSVHKIGYNSDFFYPEYFEIFNGSITLSNARGEKDE